MSYYDDLKITLNKKRIDFFEGNEFNIFITLPLIDNLKELSYIRPLFFLDLVGQFAIENFLDIKINIIINDLFHTLKSINDTKEYKINYIEKFNEIKKKININFKYNLIFASELKKELFSFYESNFKNKNTYSQKSNYNEFIYINTNNIKLEKITKNTNFKINNNRKNSRDFSIAIFDTSKEEDYTIENFIPTTTLILSFLLNKYSNNKTILIYNQYNQKLKHNLDIIQEFIEIEINKNILFNPVYIKKRNKNVTIDEIEEENINRLRLILLYLNPEKTVKLSKTTNDFFNKLIFSFKEIYYETSFIYEHTNAKYLSYKDEKSINKLKEALYFSKYFATEELNYSKSVCMLKKIFKDIYEYLNDNEIDSKQVIYEIKNFLKLTNSFFKLLPQEEKIKFHKLVDHQKSLVDEYIKAKNENNFLILNKIDLFLEKHNLKIKNTPYGYFLLEMYKNTPLIKD